VHQEKGKRLFTEKHEDKEEKIHPTLLLTQLTASL